MDRSKLDKITSFQEAINKYDSKDITVDELSFVIKRLGVNIDFWKWNMATEPNPQYPDGNEESRTLFKWNQIHNEKGRFYQSVTKKIVLSTINMVHKYTLERYHKDQFVYDDPRLKNIDIFLKKIIDEDFQDSREYKVGFMHKIVDICLGTICKEDVYYRSRLFDMINKFVKEYPNGFELTKAEKENVERWRYKRN